MKKRLFLTIIFIFLFFPISTNAEEAKERVIVTFMKEIDYEFLNKNALEIHHVFEEYLAASISIKATEREELRKSPVVKYLEDDTDVAITSTPQVKNWGIEMIQSEKGSSLGLTGRGVKIGVIDSGIHINHPDLKIAGGASFVDGGVSYHDENGHGTHVAGIIAALNNDIGMVGVAPEAELYAIKVLGRSGEGSQSNVVAGVQWAIENKMDIINLSLTAPVGSSLLKQVLEIAYEKGILIVASAGNSETTLSNTTDVLYPSRYSTVIAVGSIGKNSLKSRFSYFGPSLEFVAPGEEILSTYIGSNEYALMSGTSMASPFVAATAALYKEAFPQLKHEEIRSLMRNSAVDLGEVGKDSTFGYGLVKTPDHVQRSTPTVFPDVSPDSWYGDEVAFLYDKKIVTGYVDGKFNPNKPVSRSEAITMIGKALEYSGEKGKTIFKDVSEGYFASGYIRTANAEGIIQGYPDGRFGPDDAITRGDTALILEKAFKVTGPTTNTFHDLKKTDYYYGAVSVLYSSGIVSGYLDGSFQPKNQISRAEFAVLLAKAIDETQR